MTCKLIKRKLSVLALILAGFTFAGCVTMHTAETHGSPSKSNIHQSMQKRRKNTPRARCDERRESCRDGKVVLSDWRVRLLETIDETGSLSRAAEKLEVPYRTAWYKLKEIEDRLGVKLLETQSGGTGGGGSRLTADARQLITRFRRVCVGIGELVEQRFRTESRDLLG